MKKPTMTVYFANAVGSHTRTFAQDFADHIASEELYLQTLPQWVNGRDDIDRWAEMSHRGHVVDTNASRSRRLIYFKYLSRNRLLCVWL